MTLLEREAPLEALAATVAGAEASRGSVVLLEGPAGIGKSAVLEAAFRPGLRWLRARGGELERDLPLGVARQLFEPVLADADPATRARLLEGTGPAAGVLEGTGAADADAAALLHGLHRLVRNLARQTPLVLAVDDVHWADAASLRVLAFVAHRMQQLPAALLLARRTGESSTDETALHVIESEPVTERHELHPLTSSAAARLIGELAGAPADERFCAACHAASAGNPFILRQLLNALHAADVTFDATGAERVGEAGRQAVGRWVLARLGRLPSGAASLARAVAVLGQHADLGRAARLARLPLEDAGPLLDALVEHDLLAPGRPLEFVHPIVRAAIHDGMPPGQRSNAHRAAARLLHDQQAERDAVAMHLLAVEPGGEPWIAEALLEGADMALRQGAPEIAAAHVERALVEPAPPELRPRLLHALGNAERRLGIATADQRFLAAFQGTSDLRERAKVLLDMVITGGPEADVIPHMRATLQALEAADPELALVLRARLVLAMETSAEPLEPELRAAEDVLAAHPENTFGARLMAATLAFHKAVAGAPRPDVLALGIRAIGDDAAYLADLDAGYPHIYGIGGLGLVYELALPQRRLDAAIGRALERGSLVGAVIALFYRAHLRRLTGRLTLALGDARSALDHAARTNEPWLTAMSVSALVETLVELGQFDDARVALADHDELDTRLPPPPLAQMALTRSAIALACGDLAGAHAQAITAGGFAEALGARNPIILPWRARAALALVALGRGDEAKPIAQEGLRIAEAAEIPAAIGAARRVLATTSGGQAAIPLLREAVAELESAPMPLELARALIDLGAALRRSGRRREAREPLGRALELAHRHRAAPLALAARTELRAAGARPRREMRTGVDALTPSERRVAELAAAGLSNAEIAARLFITAKTTEHHLAATYRKLNISSRRQLRALLDRAEAAAAHEGQSR